MTEIKCPFHTNFQLRFLVLPVAAAEMFNGFVHSAASQQQPSFCRDLADAENQCRFRQRVVLNIA